MRTFLIAVSILIVAQQSVTAEAPTANYLFPAGAQRGTKVNARIGGCNLHRAPQLIWIGSGVTAPSELSPTEKIWFEGPVIPQPASQQKEDYPRDFAAPLEIAPDAPLGRQTWRLSTSQGVTTAWGFVVGTLPEVIEHEVDGDAPATRVDLPVTINGRIFPREDVDAWSFVAKAGQTIVCQVATSEFGSPLNARIEVRGPNGQVLGEQLPEGTSTPNLKLVAPVDGEYQVRIHDVAFGGLQDHVYRLAVSTGPLLEQVYPLGGQRGRETVFEFHGANLAAPQQRFTLPATGSQFVLRLPDDQRAVGEVCVELDDLTEILEAEPNDAMPQTVSVPTILNGRIQSPGDVDVWTFTAKKGTEYDFDVRAARLGSPLDAVLELQDATGKRLADADDSPGLQTDARLRWSAPADGEYRLAIKDRLASRGDARFAYRIRIVSSDQPEMSLTSTNDTLILERGKTTALKISLDRGPGFKEAVELSLDGLPAGVTVSPAQPLVIGTNQRELQFNLKAEADAAIAVKPVKIIGRTKVGERELVAQTQFHPTNPEPGRLALADGTEQCWVGVAVPTPFKFVGIFETKFISRGSVFIRKYHIDRHGFEGPLEVQLADRQGRHLQGVTATPVVVPAGQSDFEFAVTLPPWMEIGRTCRSTLAVTGQVTDPDGRAHIVSYSSNDQHNQMIALVDPGRFAVQLPRTTLSARPGQQIELPVRIQRSHGLAQSVSVELVASGGVNGVSAATIEISGDRSEGSLPIKLAEKLAGLELRPMIIRAHTKDERGLPVTAETSLTLVKTP